MSRNINHHNLSTTRNDDKWHDEDVKLYFHYGRNIWKTFFKFCINQQQTEVFLRFTFPFWVTRYLIHYSYDCSLSTRGEIPRTYRVKRNLVDWEKVCAVQCRYVCDIYKQTHNILNVLNLTQKKFKLILKTIRSRSIKSNLVNLNCTWWPS